MVTTKLIAGEIDPPHKMVRAVYSKLFPNPIRKTLVSTDGVLTPLAVLPYHRFAGPVTEWVMTQGVMKRFLACALVLCILVVGGLASAQSISHESHHNTHHQKATHSTSLCTWMCAAGNVLDNGTAPYLIDLVPVACSEPYSTVSILNRPLHRSTSRGPPVISTI